MTIQKVPKGKRMEVFQKHDSRSRLPVLPNSWRSDDTRGGRDMSGNTRWTDVLINGQAT